MPTLNISGEKTDIWMALTRRTDLISSLEVPSLLWVIESLFAIFYTEDGMVWNTGEQMEFFNPQTGELDLVHALDEVRLEVEQFNKRVVTEEFNRVVCEAYIEPALPEKTLIFCF